MNKLFKKLNLNEEVLVSAGMDSCDRVKFFGINEDYLQLLLDKTIDSDVVGMKQNVALFTDNIKHRNSALKFSKSYTYSVPYNYGKSKTKSKRCQFFSW